MKQGKARTEDRVYYATKGPDGKQITPKVNPTGARRRAALRARRLSSTR